jgi:hypothetical protein
VREIHVILMSSILENLMNEENLRLYFVGNRTKERAITKAIRREPGQKNRFE